MTPVQITQQLAKVEVPHVPRSWRRQRIVRRRRFSDPFLALQTVTPRAQGRVVQSDGSNPPVTLSAVDPALDRSKFLRLDLEDLPLPSFHRPD